MACLELKPRAAGWQAQTNPLSYGSTPPLCQFVLLSAILPPFRLSFGLFHLLLSCSLIKESIQSIESITSYLNKILLTTNPKLAWPELNGLYALKCKSGEILIFLLSYFYIIKHCFHSLWHNFIFFSSTTTAHK